MIASGTPEATAQPDYRGQPRSKRLKACKLDKAPDSITGYRGQPRSRQRAREGQPEHQGHQAPPQKRDGRGVPEPFHEPLRKPGDDAGWRGRRWVERA